MSSAEAEINCLLFKRHTVSNGETKHHSLHGAMEGKAEKRMRSV